MQEGSANLTRSIQSIQVHLTNGMNSPEVPFKNQHRKSGSETLLAEFNYSHVRSISYRLTEIGNYQSFTSFRFESMRVGDRDPMLEESKFSSNNG